MGGWGRPSYIYTTNTPHTQQLAEGRFAILALPKRTAPDDTSVLDDPVVRVSSLGMGLVRCVFCPF